MNKLKPLDNLITNNKASQQDVNKKSSWMDREKPKLKKYTALFGIHHRAAS